MNQDEVADTSHIPSSWNYGSFHLQSRLYGSFLQNKPEGGENLRPKYEPLSNMWANSHGGKFDLPPHGTPRHFQRRSSKAERVKTQLKMENIEPRKVITSTGWQRTSKSVECPQNKVATEEYYRALKVYKEVSNNAK